MAETKPAAKKPRAPSVLDQATAAELSGLLRRNWSAPGCEASPRALSVFEVRQASWSGRRRI